MILMMGEEIVEKRKISLAETLHLLEERKKVSALSYSQQTSYDYCKKFSALSYEDTNELLAKLVNLPIPKDVAINIVDVFPKSKLTLQIIMAKNESDVDKVMVILNEYKEKAKEYRAKVDAKIATEAVKKEKEENRAKEKVEKVTGKEKTKKEKEEKTGETKKEKKQKAEKKVKKSKKK